MAHDPIFRVALPAWLHEALSNEQGADSKAGEEKKGAEVAPVDVTGLVVEFSASLDSLAVARMQTRELLDGENWRLVGECVVSTTILRVLREMAGDRKLLQLVGDRYPSCVGDSVLVPRAMPLLLGIAAASAVGLRAGRVSASVVRRAVGEPRSERQRSDDSSPTALLNLQSPSLGGRPTLTPLPDDLAEAH